MLCCFMCEALLQSKKELFNHFKSQHGLSERKYRYKCGQPQCCRTFSDKYSFSKHLDECHSTDIVTDSQSNASLALDCFDDTSVNDDCTVNNEEINNSSLPIIDVTDLAFNSILEAKNRLTTFSNVAFMIKTCSSIVETLVTDLEKEFKAIESHLNESDVLRLREKLTTYKNPFAGLETDDQHKAFMKKKGLYVEPENVCIGKRNDFVIDKQTGFVKTVEKDVTVQHVSVKQTISVLHKNTDLVKMAIKYPELNNLQPQELTSFFDGLHWLNHPARNQHTLVLRLYGDDVEPANPLGSHRTIYKIGCMYYQLEGLPLHILSKTSNIFLATCYHTEDVKEYSWELILKPLITELKELETVGIDLEICGKMINVKVIVGCMTGDNLFLNGILGFVESFAAGHPCRQCIVHKDNFKNATIEQHEMLRTVELYNMHAAQKNTFLTGIKENSIFNSLRYFHAVTSNVQDIMHDLLEGVCAYDMKLVCASLVQSKLFSLEQLNNSVQALNYGYHDSTSKPPVITSFDNEILSFDASQMWTFIRYLPFAIGQCVPLDNRAWNFYVLLRKIMNLVMAPSISQEEIKLLMVLIAEYIELRCELFPDSSIKSKHHNMTHYPSLIIQFGPLIHLWCMRFEQKHQRYKRLLHIAGNFKNVLLTLANRHQHDVAYGLINRQTKVDDSLILIGSINEVLISDLLYEESVKKALVTDNTSKLYEGNWVDINGTLYKPGCYLWLSYDHALEMPIFGCVESIYVESNQTVVFFCEYLETIGFDDQFFSWKVDRQWPKQYRSVNPLDCKYYLPLSLQSVKTDNGLESYLCPRHRL